MITTPTTLILGAGASVPFGFPTGFALLQKVLMLTHPESLVNGIKNFAFLKCDQTEIVRFHNELLKSGQESVDSFLEFRPEFIPIGKTAIALALISCEKENALFNPDGENWYRYLFSRINAVFDDVSKNHLNILTFNYDRSLEHFLLTALTNKYGKTVQDCAAMLKNIPIVHLHGDLGALPDLDLKGGMIRAYDTQMTESNLIIASNRIKIIHEGVDNSAEFEQAHKILAHSKIICFLGFGYHPLNVKRLGFIGASYPHAFLAGSTYGLEQAECEYITRMFYGRFKPMDIPLAFGTGVLEFLRKSGILLR